MFEMFLTVYFVVSTVFAAPVPNDDSLGNVLRVSSDDTLCDGDGSCGFNFTSSDTYKARKTFNDYIFDTTVSVIYLYLKEKSSDQNNLKQYLPEETYRNGLQEWIWLKRERMYEELSLPIDLNSLTFTITKYGTRQMDIPWSLSSNCHLNSRISYDNETRNVLNYLWTSITKNETGSLLCHRSFDDKTLLGTKAIWFITTVWIGYDFDCFLIDSLMNEEYEVTEQTKYDITEILTVVLGLLAYMHPFIIHIVEIAQPSINTELNKYYKNKDQYEKPFGVTRVMQKIFFTPWYDRQLRTKKVVKYAPIVRFYFFWTLIVFGLNFYKLKINNKELFEKDEYNDFPTIYKYGIPEYQFLNDHPNIPFAISIASYFICNVWLYILYNETDDFIICFGRNACCCCCSPSRPYLCLVPVKDIMETEGNTEHDRWVLNASKKLIFRFTMLFCLKFWLFIFKSSFFSIGNWCNEHVSDNKLKIALLFPSAIVCTLFLIINIFLNILFCSMPALWMIFFIPCSMIERCRTKRSKKPQPKTGNQGTEDNFCCTICCTICFILEFILFLVYILTVREHAGFFVFISRSFAYTVIAGLTVSEHVWRWYLVCIFSFAYFANYILEFLDSYTALLNTIFEICEKDKKTIIKNSIDEDLFDYIVDNCYTARKRFFLLVIKTFLTTIFMVVSFQILKRTGRFDEMKSLNETLSILVILISPKIFSFLTESKPAEELEKHVLEIEALYEKYSKKNEIKQVNTCFEFFEKHCFSDCQNGFKNCFCCQLCFVSFCYFSPNLSGANPLFSKTDIPTQMQAGITLPNMGASGSNTNNTSHNPNTDNRETSINEDDTNEKSKLLGKNDKGRNYTV